ncbi:hypothetical protein HMPREF0185_00936 [Brevundimonas diminuta 470-4]|nr:hypothetical protein HMPREF0185_00936 [Brevundimonas diminuta 470-4]
MQGPSLEPPPKAPADLRCSRRGIGQGRRSDVQNTGIRFQTA